MKCKHCGLEITQYNDSPKLGTGWSHIDGIIYCTNVPANKENTTIPEFAEAIPENEILCKHCGDPILEVDYSVSGWAHKSKHGGYNVVQCSVHHNNQSMHVGQKAEPVSLQTETLKIIKLESFKCSHCTLPIEPYKNSSTGWKHTNGFFSCSKACANAGHAFNANYAKLKAEPHTLPKCRHCGAFVLYEIESVTGWVHASNYRFDCLNNKTNAEVNWDGFPIVVQPKVQSTQSTHKCPNCGYHSQAPFQPIYESNKIDVTIEGRKVKI